MQTTELKRNIENLLNEVSELENKVNRIAQENKSLEDQLEAEQFAHKINKQDLEFFRSEADNQKSFIDEQNHDIREMKIQHEDQVDTLEEEKFFWKTLTIFFILFSALTWAIMLFIIL